MASATTPTTSHRGLFIVLEGIDCSGKSTQASMLANALADSQQRPVLEMRFPMRDTPVGKLIDAHLSGETTLGDIGAHLLFSVNRWEQVDTIRDASVKGQHIVCDRYAHSGVAYTAAKMIPRYGWRDCMQADIGLPEPDMLIYLDMKAKEAATRKGFGNERYEKVEFQEAVHKEYESLRIMDEARRKKWVCIDAHKSVEAVHEAILEAVVPEIMSGNVSSKPLGRLWDD